MQITAWQKLEYVYINDRNKRNIDIMYTDSYSGDSHRYIAISGFVLLVIWYNRSPVCEV